MQMGMIGLGRMGGNIVRRLTDHGHTCVVYDRAPEAVSALTGDGAIGAADLKDMVEKLATPRIVWVMLPAGEITGQTVTALGEILTKGDIIIDGGNSFWHDDIARAKVLAERGIHYVDIGTSGGVWGRERGYCMMIGGDPEAVAFIDPILSALAPGIGTLDRTPRAEGADPRPEHGYLHCGPVGSGHFVKMIHNGIEYGMMQALAEGFDILRNANSAKLPEAHRFDLNVGDVAEVWRRGSVVSSWLLDLVARSLASDPALDAFTGAVQDSGEGRWTVDAAITEEVPAEVLTAALYVRFRSRKDHTFAEKLLSAMRFQFGGHVEQRGK